MIDLFSLKILRHTLRGDIPLPPFPVVLGTVLGALCLLVAVLVIVRTACPRREKASVSAGKKALKLFRNLLEWAALSFLFLWGFQVQSRSVLSLNPESEFLPKFTLARETQPGKTPVLTIAHFSDLHGADNINLKRYLRFCRHYSDYIDVRLNTGDVIPRSYSDDFSWYTRTSGSEKILFCIGNHDVAEMTEGRFDWAAHNGAEAYERYFAPFLQGWDVQHPGGQACYYYKDFPENRIRLVVLDMMDYTAGQDQWLSEVLEDARTAGLHVTVASHFTGTPCTRVECRFSSPTYTGVNGGITFMPDPAMCGKAAETIDTFIGNGGRFTCWLVGHTHVDMVCRVQDTAYPQLVIISDTAQYGALNNPDSSHRFGTRSQDAFNIISIDTDNQLVKVFKVGADKDRRLRKKDGVCLSYATGEPVGE